MGCFWSITKNIKNINIINITSARQVLPIKNDVDLALDESRLQEKFIFKILLLGAGESGKSTVVKQIKMLYKNSSSNATNTEREMKETITSIRRNVIEAIQTLIDASKNLEAKINCTTIVESMNTISELSTNSELTLDLAQLISDIWNNPDIKIVYSQRDKFWHMDATPYYMAEIFRIADPFFEPTDEDIVMTRVRTTGLLVSTVNEKPYTYQLVDVGGQRSERRKWIHCFDDVHAIIFLEGLSGYNQVLFEDNSVNRMHESINLFADIIRNPLFLKTPIFLFLNKKDLFEEMIKICPLTKCFPDYTGPAEDAGAAVKFIEQKYRSVMKQFLPNKPLYVQVIAARVRMDMKIAFGEVREELKRLYSGEKKK